MVEVKGKRGRKVLVLLIKEVKFVFSVLIEKWVEVGVYLKNFYLFFVIGGSFFGYFRLWECLRKIVIDDVLFLIRFDVVISIKLRKYVVIVF